MIDVSEYDDLLKKMLKPERYRHSLGAMETARKLALKWGADADRAQIAGLLHDITKNMPDAEQLEMMRKSGVPLRATRSIHWAFRSHGTMPSSTSPAQSASVA